MPRDMKLNTSDFAQFIRDQGTVTPEEANVYATLGDQMIKLAMECKNEFEFLEKMKSLENEANEVVWRGIKSDAEDTEKFKTSNMASCLLYAQTRANFAKRQGYYKGANINQYGTPEQSAQPVKNLMFYFSFPHGNRECGYKRPSTHGQWRKSPVEGVIIDKLGIDFPSKPGAIPPPQKKIHTLHLVPGVDHNGTVKLLIKPENWGLKALHMIFHAIDWILTRFSKDEAKGYDQRQETKKGKEVSVTEVFTDLTERLKKITNKSLRSLFDDVSQELKKGIEKKGFEEPLKILGRIIAKVDKWIKDNPNHQNKQDVQDYLEDLRVKTEDLLSRKDAKYPSSLQKNSEVRLEYKLNEGELTCDLPEGQPITDMYKGKIDAMLQQGESDIEEERKQKESAQQFASRLRP